MTIAASSLKMIGSKKSNGRVSRRSSPENFQGCLRRRDNTKYNVPRSFEAGTMLTENDTRRVWERMAEAEVALCTLLTWLPGILSTSSGSRARVSFCPRGHGDLAGGFAQGLRRGTGAGGCCAHRVFDRHRSRTNALPYWLSCISSGYLHSGYERLWGHWYEDDAEDDLNELDSARQRGLASCDRDAVRTSDDEQVGRIGVFPAQGGCRMNSAADEIRKEPAPGNPSTTTAPTAAAAASPPRARGLAGGLPGRHPKKRPTVQHRPYRGYQIAGQPVLGNKCAHTHLFELGDKSGSVVDAVADHNGLRAIFQNFSSCLNTVFPWHFNIQNCQVRALEARFFHRLFAVAGFGTYIPLGPFGEQTPDGSAYRCAVVDEKDFCVHGDATR